MFDSFLTSDLAKGWYLALLRKGAAALGVWLIAHGALQSTQLNDLAGSIIFLGSVGWSLWTEYKNQVARPDKTTGKDAGLTTTGV